VQPRRSTENDYDVVPGDASLVSPGPRRRRAAALVLVGELTYVLVALSIQDPVRYATPLLLMFPSFVAAWFLERRGLPLTMAATTLACFVALEHSRLGVAGVVIQLTLTAGVLNATAVGLFLLRRRVERLLAATRALSTLDPLTGLVNRRSLVEQAPRLWRQARREGTRVAAMVLDLDHFKQLNDAHGHAAGDAVLFAVARSLGGTVRPADVLARTGGEELVVLGMVSDAMEAERLAERLRVAVARARTDAGHAVTASVGVALARPVDGEDPANALWRLIDRADAAMYEAKRQGRDQVATARPPAVPSGRPSAPEPRRP
jgi:diguanylate cyclase (GGDEF)-like protein